MGVRLNAVREIGARCIGVVVAMPYLLLPELAFAADPPTFVLTDLTPGASRSAPHGINASGQVTGLAEGVPGAHAFRSDRVSQTVLGNLPDALFDYSSGWAINDAGQVTGLAENVNQESQAILWDGVVMRELGTLGGPYSRATDINADGNVVGGATTGQWQMRAFLWDGVEMRDLGTLANGEGESWAVAINDAGQVTGWSTAFPEGHAHAFLWTDGVMLDLGTLGGTPQRSHGDERGRPGGRRLAAVRAVPACVPVGRRGAA